MSRLHPKTEKRPVIDRLHGQVLTDPYRWLEDGTTQETREWVLRQKEYTDEVIASYGMKPSTFETLAAFKNRPDIHIPSGQAGTLIYQHREPGQNHSVLYAERDGRVHTVADPNAMGSGEPAHVDWAHVSQNGRFVLFGVSQHGDEWAVLQIYDVIHATLLDDRIPRARHASIAFPAGHSGFFYTRYPLEDEVPTDDDRFYNVAVYYHTLGSAIKDDILVFKPPDDKHAIPAVSLSESGKQLAINVHYGWTRNVLYKMDADHPKTPVQLLLDPGDHTIHTFWDKDQLLALTNMDSDTGRIVKVSLNDGTLLPLVNAQPHQPLLDALAWNSRIAAHILKDGQSQVVVFDSQIGSVLHTVTLPNFAGLEALSAANGVLYYQFSGFGRPSAIHQLEYTSKTWADTVWKESGAPDTQIAVIREWVTSPDGTRFPILIARKDPPSPAGQTPTVLGGYGGFCIPYLPTYSASVHDWLNRGGQYALAMIRGGGEFGEWWHRAGMRENKQAVFDDFCAAACHLVTEGYTDTSHLGVTGRSNGGLLTGAFVTQHPKAAQAVVIGVPLLDMIRFHRFLIAELWTGEYGSPEHPEEFDWLLKYSPYHHVQDNTDYPAVLLFTSEEDSRVDPMHARKMTAALQNATASRQPILFRMAGHAGHGVGKSTEQWLDEESDIWTFLSYHLGLPR